MHLESFLTVTLWLFSYLIGSISTAVLVCRLFGWPDPRDTGSHNPGATNVLRVAGKTAAAFTLLGDVLKGVIPVYGALLLHPSPTAIGLCGFFAVLGHLYPLYFDFKGGKGVATALGAVTFLNWPSGLAIILIWLIVISFTRVASIASLTSWTAAPFIIYGMAPEYLGPMLMLSTFIIYRHYSNIVGLIQGKERDFKPPQ